MTRVLITRPRDEAADLADLLRRRRIETLVEPMLEIVPVAAVDLSIDGVQGLVFTSANGVRAFAARSARRDVPVFAVGDATTAAATAAGFAAVTSAGGNVEDLARLIIARCDRTAGPLLHIAGTVAAGDLAVRLAPLGYQVDRRVAYEARAAARLSPATRTELAAGRIDAVLFFSPRTARTFVTLVLRARAEEACRSISALCLSAAVAGVVRALPWRDIRTAPRPAQAELLALLEPAVGAS